MFCKSDIVKNYHPLNTHSISFLSVNYNKFFASFKTEQNICKFCDKLLKNFDLLASNNVTEVHRLNEPQFNAAELALLAAAITTIGDAIATMAAALAIQEEQNASNNSQNQQRQIKELQRDVQQIKQALKIR